MAGMTTPVSQGIDLGMVVPLLLMTGVLLWRCSPWGHLLAGTSMTHGFMMFISIPAWIAVPLVQQGKLNPLEASPFLAAALVGLALAFLYFRSVSDESARGIL
jgi:hypothetical protein